MIVTQKAKTNSGGSGNSKHRNGRFSLSISQKVTENSRQFKYHGLQWIIRV